MEKNPRKPPFGKSINNRGKSQNKWRTDESKKFEIDNIESEKLKERKERFAKTKSTGYGFISRGEDNRLQVNEGERILFFEEIKIDFVHYCNGPNLPEYMRTLISQREMVISSDSSNDSSSSNSKTRCDPTIDSILTSLRKLREALLFAPPNEFSKSVFLFSIRIAVAAGKYQTYVPSIIYLLERGIYLLDNSEKEEIVTLLTLHLSHFNGENNRGIEVYYKYKLNDPELLKTLKSWATGNHHEWIRQYNAESDGCRSALMAIGLPRMIKILIQEFTATYFTIDKNHLEELFLPIGTKYRDLNRYGCTWKEENNVVTIRDRTRKK
ncbi:hypothetical protein CAAN1_02S05842 [[Candida] anglica]|uniref:Uncharacterized protein n=1 Tax=[Candida] anglica TaxID=148631 RepID=A0ABP0EET7_9ASCO